jgi:RNA polymerase sigma-70 factor, ECF subfamily
VAVTQERVRFQDVAREHLPWLYSLARRLGGGERADDIVQECLTKAYSNFDGLRDTVASAAWFRTILVNCARDRFRREASGFDETPLDDVSEYSLYRTIAEEDPSPYSDTVHVDFLHSFTEDDVWEVLGRLQAMHRIPLVLVHMEGMTTAETSRLLEVPLNTLLSRLHRGRKLFERELWSYAASNDLLRDGKGPDR